MSLIAKYCVDTGNYTPPTINNNTECLSGSLRYLDLNQTQTERQLFNDWWKEQINQYGMQTNYYINLYNLSAHDYFYGEHTLAGFAQPLPVVACAVLNNDSIILSKFGLQGNAELSVVVSIQSFSQALSSSSLSGVAKKYDYEPKAGDLIEMSEYGSTRPNGRSGQIYEITERVDQRGGDKNQLLGHYVWMVNAKRYDYSYEINAPRERKMDQVYDNKSDGYLNSLPKILETKTYTQFVDKDSAKVFDYAVNPQANTNVYGDYEDTNMIVNLVGVTNTGGNTIGAVAASAANTYVVVNSPSNYSNTTAVSVEAANTQQLLALQALLSSNPLLSGLSITPINC